jgi:AcrR family transcriptional regulator
MKDNVEDPLSRAIRDFRRDQVISAARNLFSERGTVNVPMEDIAKAAGVSRSTVYNHFTTREDVLAGVLATGMQQLVGDYDEADRTAAGPCERLSAFIETTIRRVDEFPDLFRLTMALMLTDTSAAAVAHSGFALIDDEMSRILRRILAEGNDDGTIVVTDLDMAVDFVRYVVTGAVSARQARERDDPANLAVTLTRFIVDGLS